MVDGGEDCGSACTAGDGRSPVRRRARTRSANATRQAAQFATTLPVPYVQMITLRKNTTTIRRNMNTSFRGLAAGIRRTVPSAYAVQCAAGNHGAEFGPF